MTNTPAGNKTGAAAFQPPQANSGAMDFSHFDELDGILDDLRTRHDETPQWEFCEGFIAALICCRRVIGASEYLPVLLDTDTSAGSFADDAQLQRFMALWVQRWNEVALALNTPVDSLGDERAYYPEVMDLRGAVAKLSPEDRAGIPVDEIPSFGQVWAIGFMYAVESWPEEWAAPRDKKAGKLLNEALGAIVTLTEDDTGVPAVCVFEEGAEPTVSKRRLDEFADAIWAVYDLRDLWGSLGERVEPLRVEAKPGRNDPCFCGSGKKFKKCHGA